LPRMADEGGEEAPEKGDYEGVLRNTHRLKPLGPVPLEGRKGKRGWSFGAGSLEKTMERASLEFHHRTRVH